MTLEKEQLFFLISDAVGDTARQVTHAALAQYTGRCLLYTSPSPRDLSTSRMPSSA